MRALPELPITPLLPEIVASLSGVPRLVLEAPPGAGKTTQVPLALLDAPWLEGKIVMLEPRRLAARAAATFMAQSLGEEPGGTVGYRMRFESRVSARTRIEVVTEAILTRMLQDDASLPGVGALVFDEYHERNLHADLGLALALETQAQLRPELRLVVMSATLDGERIARHLDAPRIASPGRSFPVDVVYFPERPPEDWRMHARRAIQQALADTDGDVLVFLPGKREIDALARVLAAAELPSNVSTTTLHGELELSAQAAVLAPPPPGTRRIVLATNVAESSVTLPAVRAVVDTGLARAPMLDPGSGLSRLETFLIPQSSATQRTGRAGRVAPGKAYRLWPQSRRLDAAITPEIRQVELMPLALELAVWGAESLRWLDAPPAAALAEARTQLRAMGAIDAAGRITAHGRRISSLPTHPRFANAIARVRDDETGLACDLAALLEGRDVLRGEARRDDDVRTRLDALRRFRERRAPADADRDALAQVDRAAQQLRRTVRARDGADAAHATGEVLAHATGEVLAHAFGERIARSTSDDGRRYQLANGRGAHLDDRSGLRGARWLVVAELRFDERDSTILRAAPVDEGWLRTTFPERFVAETQLAWNADTRAVEAAAVERFDAIQLARKSRTVPRDADTARRLREGIAALGIAALPWGESLRQWQARVLSLREWAPELGLPDVSDAALAATLGQWLEPHLVGAARLSDVDAELMNRALRDVLDHRQRTALDTFAPTELRVPSGSVKKLDYRPGAPLALAVKLQELFGLADTPRIANGRVPVTLELLSPAQRPIQVTQDLRGFWERTYPEVRKELKGRYPRHPWPDDPWNAVPTARAKPRGK
jgi:ATP-dependent helicase HrpB